jgi:hypothetical protein
VMSPPKTGNGKENAIGPNFSGLQEGRHALAGVKWI